MYTAKALIEDNEITLASSDKLGPCISEANKVLDEHPEYRSPRIYVDDVVTYLGIGHQWLTKEQVIYRLKHHMITVKERR